MASPDALDPLMAGTIRVALKNYLQEHERMIEELRSQLVEVDRREGLWFREQQWLGTPAPRNIQDTGGAGERPGASG